MKENTHPKIHTVKVVCSCGNTFDTISTVEKLHIDICSACHPFFTGKQKLLDTAGRVERFNKKWAKQEEILKKKKSKGPRTVTIN